ncbi:hypothetical protein V4V53_004047 [Vibrio mimicus]
MKRNISHLEKYIPELLQDCENLERKVIDTNQAWGELSCSTDTEPSEWLIDADRSYIDPFKSNVELLHLAIMCYLDHLNLDEIKLVFKKNFVEGFCINKAVSETVYNDWDSQQYLSYLININRFLSIFDFYPYKGRKSDTDLSHLKVLETVLNNTAVIIHKSGKKPTSEANVYNAVKDVLAPVFPSSMEPNGRFVKIAKNYFPDILIPEIKAAVEYKYAESENKLKTTIEQVCADVLGYSGNSEYEYFYAVFYVKKDFWGQEKFQAVWRENKFPVNWKGIYVVGE